MPYGTIKVDNVTFTNAGVDQSISVSGIVASISGNITATGTISGNIIRGGTTVSGATVTGTAGQFGTVTGNTAGFTTVTGTTVTGTTANFVSGVFQNISGGTHTITSGVFASGTAAAPSITFTSDLDTGIYNSAANQVSITTSGTERLRVDATGQIESVSLGTAAAPAYTFTTDPDTGLYSPAANEVALATNGSGRLFVNSSGNVGIGLANPITPFHVRLGGDKNLAFDTGGVDFSTRITCFNDAANAALNLQLSANNLIIATTGNERLRVTSAGLVGVGTSAPSGNLDVRGVSGTPIIIAQGTDNNGDADIRIATTGSTGASRLIFSDTAGSNGSIIYRHASDSLALGTNGNTNALFIDSSGRVGIGTTSPLSILDITVGGAGARKFLVNYDDSIVTIKSSNTSSNPEALRLVGDNIRFNTGTSGSGTECARIDSSGRLLVGTSSSVGTANGYTPGLQVAAQAGSISAASYRSDEYGGIVALQKSKSATVGTQTVVANGDECGILSFEGSDGSSFKALAQIRALVDGTPGANDMPGRLVFSTTADGASSPTERMRISQGGRIAFGGQGIPYSSATCDTYSNTSGEFAHVFRQDHASGYGIGIGIDGTYLAYFYPNKDLSGAPVGSITQNGSATAYNTTSDYRLKENVVAVTDGIIRLQQLKPSRFNFIATPTKTVDGFIAHEVQSVVPEAITGEKDAVDAEGNPEYQGIDQSKLVPLLTAALQEAVAKIESLEARLTAAGI